MVHKSLLSRDGDLINSPLPPSQAPLEERQPLDEGQEVTLELRPATEEVMPLEQLPHILSLYLEDLFGNGHGVQPAEEPASEQAPEQEPDPGKFLLPYLLLLIYRWEEFLASEPVNLFIQDRIFVCCHSGCNSSHLPSTPHPLPTMPVGFKMQAAKRRRRI